MSYSRKNYLVMVVVLESIGALCLYNSISIFFETDAIEKGWILIRYSNPLIRYSPSIAFLLFSLSCFLSPYLVYKNYFSIGSYSPSASEFIKAKSTIAMYLVFSPGIIFVAVTFFFSHIQITNYPLFIILLLGVAYIPAMAVFNYFKYKNEGT